MRATSLTVAAAGVGAAVALGRRITRRQGSGSRDDHWLAVTAYLPVDQVRGTGALPEPLERLRGKIEVVVRQAAGDKGTELLARPTGDEVSREDLRVALRRAKSLLETGTVIEPDARPSTHPGPAGKVLQAVVAKSKGEGRL
jgi:hypothetical protein